MRPTRKYSPFQSGLAALFFGAIAAGVLYFSSGALGGMIDEFQNPPPPTCDGQVMSYGTECVQVMGEMGAYVEGSGTSYEGQQFGEQIPRAGKIAVVGFVALMSALFAALFVLGGVSLLTMGSIEASRGFFRPHRKGPMSHS